MRLFRIAVCASLPMNNGEKEYSQRFTAHETEDEEFKNPIAAAYDEHNQIGMIFPYHFIERLVMAETGMGAILKFQKWQARGFDSDYLMSKSF